MTPTEIKNAFDQLARYDFGDETSALVLVEHAVRTANPDELFVHLNRILNSETSFAARQFACKMIWILGPDRGAPALEKLLASPDPHLVEAACYAIGNTPSAVADRLLAAAPANLAITNLQAVRGSGHDLSEWEIDTPGLWQVRNGVIIGRSPGLLRTRKRYGNFTLTAKIRMIDGDGKTGIQFRGHAFLERFDPTIWHTYTIHAEGPRIRLELDGVVTAEESGVAQDGIIALQIQAGSHPTEVWFRDVLIRPVTPGNPHASNK